MKIEDWKNATKEGDVKVTYDKTIAKHTVVIGGATPASNYVAIPASKGGQTPSLGLTGKFVSELNHGVIANFGAKSVKPPYSFCLLRMF